MRTMRMEREDIENSLKVLSHIVDDDFIITVDEARKIIRIDGETIEALQAEVERLQGKLCDWCAVCPKERRNPDDCELLGENTVMYGPSGAKMREVQE